MNAGRAFQELRGDLRECFATDADTLSTHSRDFARLLHRVPVAVARPRSVDELCELMAWAFRERVAIALRGSGHSQGGHTLVESGIVVDLRALNHIGTVDVDLERVEVEGGSTWANALASTLPASLAPRVLTSEHATTIGGTLSVGGLGSTSFQNGAQVDNVTYLDVVTGTGDLLRCSHQQNRSLFDAVRAGLGQFGVIARAGLTLRRIKPRIRTFTFIYDSAGSFLEDVGRLMTCAENGLHLLAHFTPIPGSERKRLSLTLGVEFEPGHDPDGSRWQDFRSAESLPCVDADLFGQNHIFYFRYADWFETSTDSVFPCVDHYLTWENAERYLTAVLAGRFSPLLKTGVSTIIPLAQQDAAAPLLTRRKPEPLLLVGLFPRLPVALKDLAELSVSYARQVETDFGGSRYLYGYADPALSDWSRQFGDVWSWMQEMKAQFDPAGVLNSALVGLGKARLG